MNWIDAATASGVYRACGLGQEIDDIRLLGEGWDSIVYLVNDTQVLRFPKSLSAAVSIATEIRLLPQLGERLPLPIPQPNFVGAHPSQTSWPCMGYACINGVELSRERWQQLSQHAADSVMPQLGAFLEALHAVDLAIATRCGVRARDSRTECSDVLTRSQATVLPLLERRDRATFIRRSEAMLGDPANFSVRPTLIHGDLSPEHLLYDPQMQRLSGVIDFGDAAIGDPDYDLMYLLEDYGERFIHALLSHYRHDDAARLIGKLEAFRLFDAARYVLFGQARADQTMIADGLGGLRELLGG